MSIPKHKNTFLLSICKALSCLLIFYVPSHVDYIATCKWNTSSWPSHKFCANRRQPLHLLWHPKLDIFYGTPPVCRLPQPFVAILVTLFNWYKGKQNLELKNTCRLAHIVNKQPMHLSTVNSAKEMYISYVSQHYWSQNKIYHGLIQQRFLFG